MKKPDPAELADRLARYERLAKQKEKGAARECRFNRTSARREKQRACMSYGAGFSCRSLARYPVVNGAIGDAMTTITSALRAGQNFISQ
ncbi:hypothetical protein [Pandoraea sputorum]|uniref:hypothetical protein n=1 Tax=Pandoraea sputorum TaxID=93222 RepID=UPI002F90A816